MSREAIMWTVGAYFGGSVVGLGMSIAFAFMLSRMHK